MRTAFWTTAIGLGLVLICSWHACSMAAPAASPPSSPAASTPHSFLAAAVPSTSPVASTFSAAAPHLHLHSSTASSSAPSAPSPAAAPPSSFAFINLHKNILIAMRLRSLLLLFVAPLAAYQRHVMSPPTPAEHSSGRQTHPALR